MMTVWAKLNDGFGDMINNATKHVRQLRTDAASAKAASA
jgi:hypothetical protein|tara:strand:- start:370 stop:486 length:117 start_codon:yes stop_codon:yes gene_type:complete